MLFKKSTATSRFQIMTLAMGFFTSLWDLWCTSRDKACIHPECVEEKDQTQGMITSMMGLAALTERHARVKGITLLCVHRTCHRNQGRNCSQIPDWKTETWN